MSNISPSCAEISFKLKDGKSKAGSGVYFGMKTRAVQDLNTGFMWFLPRFDPSFTLLLERWLSIAEVVPFRESQDIMGSASAHIVAFLVSQGLSFSIADRCKVVWPVF